MPYEKVHQEWYTSVSYTHLDVYKRQLEGYLSPQGIITPQEVTFGKSVYCFMEDKQGNIWIACYGGGLNLLSHAPDGSTNFIHSGNRLKNLSLIHIYPISVSSERIFQALAIARYANEIGADAIAHGSTGAGNDQRCV